MHIDDDCLASVCVARCKMLSDDCAPSARGNRSSTQGKIALRAQGPKTIDLLAQKNPSALTSCHFRFCSRPHAAALRRNELVQRYGNHGQHSARYATEHQTALRSFPFCWYCVSHANTLRSIHAMSLSHPPNRAHQRGTAHSNQRRFHQIA